MKCVLIGPTYPFRGGISHYTTLLYKELVKEHSVKFISFKRQYPKILFPGKSDREPGEGFLAGEVEYLLDPLNPFTWWRTATQIRQWKPEIVIMQWWIFFWAPAWWVLTTLLNSTSTAKIIFLCHNIFPHEAGLFDKQIAKAVLRSGDAFVVHAEAEKDRLLELLPHANVKVSPHPTYQVFYQTGLSPENIRAEMGLNKNDVVFLFFGFVRPYKGVDILLDAMAQIPDNFSFSLLIVGEFWLPETEIREQIRILGLESRVRLINRYIHNEEVAQFFVAADAVVLPYRQATQSGVAQIAYGFARPIIVTEVGGLAEIVQDGLTGYVVPPHDSASLARALRTFLELTPQEKERMCRNIQAETDKFSWRRLVATLIIAAEIGNS